MSYYKEEWIRKIDIRESDMVGLPVYQAFDKAAEGAAKTMYVEAVMVNGTMTVTAVGELFECEIPLSDT